MASPLDHDIRTWVTAEEYLAAIHAAESDDRTVSCLLRHLLRAHLADRALVLAGAHARDVTGPRRADEGHDGR